MSSKSEMEELISFLNPKSPRPDIIVVALQHVLGMSASEEGLNTLKDLATVEGDLQKNVFRTLVSNLVGLLTSKQNPISKDSSLTLINLTANEELVKWTLNLYCDFDKTLAIELWDRIKDKDSTIADQACMILSNLTHESNNCSKIYNDLTKGGVSLDKIITVFCNESYNNKGANLHYLSPLISNLSQVADARKQLVDKNNPVIISKLLAFVEYKTSYVRRGGVIGTLRNCCFDTADHEWLLSEDNGIDLLPRLLLPLAGPTPSDMDPDEIDKLPVDLQYLDDEKEIEKDPDLRKMLLEAIHQLCATRTGREIIRLRNAYPILKELHKTENDMNVKLACENIVDILIKKEGSGEITVDNFHDVDIPPEVVPELEKMDEDYLKDDK